MKNFYVKEKQALIEVTYYYHEKHKNKLIKAMDELKIKKGVIIAWDYESEEEIKERKLSLFRFENGY